MRLALVLSKIKFIYLINNSPFFIICLIAGECYGFVMIRLLPLFIVAWLTACPHVTLAQEPHYVIGTPCLDVELCESPEVEALFREAYRRINATVEFTYLPLLRDLIEANSGLIDGSLVRSKTVISEYKNLLFVETPISTNTLVAFTIAPHHPVKKWDDLRGLRVGVIRGVVLSLNLCEKHGIAPYVVNSIPQAFAMLGAGRLDALVYNLHIGTVVAKSQGLDVYVSKVRHVDMFHHALNSKHADIVPKLSQVFREMLEDGTSEKLLGKWAVALPDPDK